MKNDNLVGQGFHTNPERINKKGRAGGAKNRTTIVRDMLGLIAKLPASDYDSIKELLPKINNRLTIEQAMTLVQIDKAIRKADTVAYKALMDSAYGSPTQPIDMVEERPIIVITRDGDEQP